MDYKKLCDVYEAVEATSKGLEKTRILSDFLSYIKDTPDTIYLLQGRVFGDYDPTELGLSEQLAVRIIAKTAGVRDDLVIEEFKKLGELGLAAEAILKKKKTQSALFSSKLTIDKVMKSLKKIPSLEGKGSIDQKIGVMSELLHSAEPVEAKYLIRTILGDLKIGAGSGIIRDAIVEYVFQPKDIAEKKAFAQEVQEAFDKVSDFSIVFEKAMKKKLSDIDLIPGRPVKVMLFPKAKDVLDAFEIIGRPAAFEYKYDGFRVMINKTGDGEIRIFTRRLDEVTRQFPDIVHAVQTRVKGKSFMIDAEAVGYKPKTGAYTPFQDISQRIRRKYGIEVMAKELPVELVVFDIIYYEGESLIASPFQKRRKLLEKIVSPLEKHIVLAEQLITDKDSEVEAFYEKALSLGQEGLMGKSLSAPYKPGARIGYAVKLKPEDNDFDLVITGAEWGTGKRAGWLTSFDVSCRGESGELLELGKVSTGLKEKKEEGLSFEDMTEKLKPITISSDGRTVKVKPEIVVTVQYQNIQKSPTYSSGYALRFPRIKLLRPDRGIEDIASVEDVEERVGEG